MALSVGDVSLQLTLDSTKFEKALDAVGKKTKKHSESIANNFKKATDSAGKSVAKQFEGANTELQKAEAKLKDLQAQAEKWEKDYRASGQMNRAHIKDDSTAELKRSTEEYIKSTRERFDVLIEAEKRHVAELKSAMGDATDVGDIGDDASSAGKKFATLAGKMALLKKIGSPAVKAVDIGLKGLGFAMKGTAKLFEASCHVIATSFNVLNKLVKVALAGIVFGIGMLALLWKQGMEDLISSDRETANSVASLRSALDTLRLALASAFAPIVNIAIPYLVKLINWITSAVTAIGHLVSALTGKKTTLVAKKQMGGVGKAVGGIGSSAGKANKQAKELQRTLMGFDKINKLDKENKGSGGGGGGGGGGGAGGAGGLYDTVPVDAQASKFADKLKESWKKADFTWLGALLAEKINKAMAGIPWDKIKKGAWRIAHSLGTFINGFVDKFDWGLLGRTISDAILTMFKFVTTFLETVNWQKIGKAIVDFFTGIKWGALFKGASRIVGNIAGAIAGVFFGAVKRAGQKLRTYLFGTGKLTIKGFFNGLLKGIKGIGKFIINNLFKPFIKGFKKAFGISSPSKVMKEQGKYVVDGLLEGIKEKAKAVIDWFKDFPSKIKDKLASAFEDFDLGDIFDGAKDAVANVTVGLKDDFSGAWNKIKDAWNGLKDKTAEAWSKLKDSFSAVWDKIKGGWNAVVSKTATATAKISDLFSTTWGKIKDGWNALKNKTATVTAKLYSNIKTQTLQKIAKAFNKLKSKTVNITLNLKAAMAKGFNKFATKYNSFRTRANKLPGINLPGPIPYLAQGAWLKKNTPQLAVVGDNKHEGEVVAPDSKLEAMARQVASEAGGAGNAQVISLLTQILRAIGGIDTNVYLDGKAIADSTVKRINQQTRTTGQFPLIV